MNASVKHNTDMRSKIISPHIARSLSDRESASRVVSYRVPYFPVPQSSAVSVLIIKILCFYNCRHSRTHAHRCPSADCIQNTFPQHLPHWEHDSTASASLRVRGAPRTALEGLCRPRAGHRETGPGEGRLLGRGGSWGGGRCWRRCELCRVQLKEQV